MMLSNFVAVDMTSHQNFLLSCWLKPACIIIALDLPIRVGIFLSTTEFLLRGARGCELKYYSKVLSVTFFLETTVFSTIVQPYILHNNPIFGIKSLDPSWNHNCLVALFLKKKLWLQSLNSSTTINQCLFPPMLSCLNELLSMNILYLGLLGTCFCFLFGTLACLIFTSAHTSHGLSFPVILIPMFSAVVFRRCSPVCPVIWWNFHTGILFLGSITACA